MIDYPEPVYVRVGRAAVPDVYENDDFDFVIGKANMLLDGTDLTIIGTGETVYHAHQAALELRKYGISVRVLDMSFIKPCDEEAVLKLLLKPVVLSRLRSIVSMEASERW